MLRMIVATGLAVLGTGLAGSGQAGVAEERPVAAVAYTARAAEPLCAQDAMAEGLARIAARAAAPQADRAQLTKQDRVALYLLLSLRGTPDRTTR